MSGMNKKLLKCFNQEGEFKRGLISSGLAEFHIQSESNRYIVTYIVHITETYPFSINNGFLEVLNHFHVLLRGISSELLEDYINDLLFPNNTFKLEQFKFQT